MDTVVSTTLSMIQHEEVVKQMVEDVEVAEFQRVVRQKLKEVAEQLSFKERFALFSAFIAYVNVHFDAYARLEMHNLLQVTVVEIFYLTIMEEARLMHSGTICPDLDLYRDFFQNVVAFRNRVISYIHCMERAPPGCDEGFYVVVKRWVNSIFFVDTRGNE